MNEVTTDVLQIRGIRPCHESAENSCITRGAHFEPKDLRSVLVSTNNPGYLNFC